MSSLVARNRTLERKLEPDEHFRKLFFDGRPLRSQAEPLTDEDLLTKLRSFGVDLDRSSLGRLCTETLSAEELARSLLAKGAIETQADKHREVWVWICLDALWRRWFPEIPSFEILDDKIHAGYERYYSGDLTGACTIWVDAWNDVPRLCDRGSIRSISEFDDRFKGTHFLSDWIQELEIELWNADFDDQPFLNARIAVCEEVLRRFDLEMDDDLIAENLRHALAESYFELGEAAKADELYRTWLDKDPQWGWGWIGWSDCYRFNRRKFKDLHKAEELLLQGFSIAGMRDFEDLADRLAELYEKTGRVGEGKKIRRQIELISPRLEHEVEIVQKGNVVRHKSIVDFGEEGLPLSELPKNGGPISCS
jgi:tetratricopeptide (TPR) repeat protein